MKKWFLSIFSAVILIFLAGGVAYSWSAFNKAPSHSWILQEALRKLLSDEFIGKKNIPAASLIIDQDKVFVGNGISGTGPDVEGMSPYSFHYYNPQTNEGSAPYAVGLYYAELAKNLRNYQTHDSLAKLFAWSGHFLADMHVPYHTLGLPAKELYSRPNGKIYPNEYGPFLLYDSHVGLVTQLPPAGWGGDYNFSAAIQAFKTRYPLMINGQPNPGDWFDPWYLNGIQTISYLQVGLGSHASWEADAYLAAKEINLQHFLSKLNSESRYDPLWVNDYTPFNGDIFLAMRERVRIFTVECAKRTRDNTKRYWQSPELAMANAIRAIHTMWRAAFTVMNVQPMAEDHGDKMKLIVRVGNLSSMYEVRDINVHLTLFVDGQRQDLEQVVKRIGSKSYVDAHWVGQLRAGAKVEMKGEASGIYIGTPDFGYNAGTYSFVVPNRGDLSVNPLVPNPPGPIHGNKKWIVWHDCKGPSFACVLALSHISEEDLRKKPRYTILGIFNSEREARSTMCSRIYKVQPGGQFAAGTLGYIDGKIYCVAVFFKWNSRTKQYECL